MQKITSFNNRENSDFRYRNSLIRDTHVPISPCDPHPDTGMLLLLEGGAELRKRSYAKTSAVYEVEYRWLGPYDDSERAFELTESSLEDLVDAMRLAEIEGDE